MTLNASGDLLLNRTTTINSSQFALNTASATGVQQGIVLNNPFGFGAGVGTAASALTFTRMTGATYIPVASIQGWNTDETSSNRGHLTFSTQTSVVAGLVERMRIDSDGRIVSGGDIYLGGAGVYTASEAAIIYNGNGDLILSADPNNISASSNLRFNVDNTEHMRINASGNLGLGVTPRSWYGNTWAIELGNRYASIYSGSGQGGSPNIIMATNSYSSSATGVDTYIATASASKYVQSNANHIWYTAPSGSAGNAITFTQAMTLHDSGGVSIGNTTDPGATNLSVSGSVEAKFNYADIAQSSYGAGTSFTLTVSDTTEGAMYLISVSRNVSSLSASNRVSLLSYRSNGAFFTDIIANANVTISVSGATITVTGVGTAVLYGSVLGLRN
jgi:hypothetical protein